MEEYERLFGLGGVSMLIVLEALGDEWLTRYEAYQDGRDDLRDLAPEDAEKEKLVAWVYLAHAIFLLQNCEGFKGRLEALKKEDIEAGIFEISTASLFMQNGHDVSFVKPSGVLGRDYDLDIEVDGCAIAVEVKTRRAGPLKDRKTLRNALKKARNQLPVDKPGVIVVSIAPQYEGSLFGEHSFAELERELNSFLARTSRVNTVMYTWHSWEGQPRKRLTKVSEHSKCLSCDALPRRFTMPRAYLIEPVDMSKLVSGQFPGFPSFSAENRAVKA